MNWLAGLDSNQRLPFRDGWLTAIWDTLPLTHVYLAECALTLSSVTFRLTIMHIAFARGASGKLCLFYFRMFCNILVGIRGFEPAREFHSLSSWKRDGESNPSRFFNPEQFSKLSYQSNMYLLSIKYSSIDRIIH